MNTRRYKVRFHLGLGSHYRHWQVVGPKGVEYYDPQENSLTLLDCKLRNHSGVARKIHDGANKSVCAWVDCAEVFVSGVCNPPGLPLFYDPRVAPHWRNLGGDNIDNAEPAVLRSCLWSLFFTGERFERTRYGVRLAPSAAEEHYLGPMKQEK